jgi:uncharacterized protein (DUF58 family)
VRLRSREESSRVHFVIDASESMRFGRPAKFTCARRLAAALGISALAGLDEVTCGLARDGLYEGALRVTGADRAGEVLSSLEAAASRGGTDLAGSLARFLDSTPPRGVVVVLSDFWWEGDLSRWARAAAELGFEGAFIQVLDPSEATAPPSGRLRLADSETGGEITVESSRALARAYSEESARFLEDLARSAALGGFRAVRLTTDVRLEDAILVRLRSAGVVK